MDRKNSLDICLFRRSSLVVCLVISWYISVGHMMDVCLKGFTEWCACVGRTTEVSQLLTERVTDMRTGHDRTAQQDITNRENETSRDQEATTEGHGAEGLWCDVGYELKRKGRKIRAQQKDMVKEQLETVGGRKTCI